MQRPDCNSRFQPEFEELGYAAEMTPCIEAMDKLEVPLRLPGGLEHGHPKTVEEDSLPPERFNWVTILPVSVAKSDKMSKLQTKRPRA